MAAPSNQPSNATSTEILRCNVVQFSVSSAWGMMPKCDLILRELDVICVARTVIKFRIKLEDLLGVNIVQKPHSLNPLACQMDIHMYSLVEGGFFSKASRRITTTSFCFYQEPTFRENLYSALQWKKEINKQCRKAMQKTFCSVESDLEQTADAVPLQLLVFINPFGGPGKAEQLFNEQVQPMFDMAEIQSTVIITKRQNHARDVIKSYDFSAIDGIVVSSGDGLIFEVINGIMERPDWETAIRKPIGVLPTGSGNGIAASLLHESKEEYSLANAAFLIIRGCAIPADVATVETHDGGKCYMSLAMGWGLVADVDIESEKMRNLGETRFVLGSVSCIIKKNVYRGVLHYLPVEEDHVPQPLGVVATPEPAVIPTTSAAEDVSGRMTGANSTAAIVAPSPQEMKQSLAPDAPPTDTPNASVTAVGDAQSATRGVEKDGTGDTRSIEKDGTGDTRGIEKDGTGDTRGIEKDGTGDTRSIEKDGTGDTRGVEKDGTGETRGVEKDGTGETRGVEKDGTSQHQEQLGGRQEDSGKEEGQIIQQEESRVGCDAQNENTIHIEKIQDSDSDFDQNQRSAEKCQNDKGEQEENQGSCTVTDHTQVQSGDIENQEGTGNLPNADVENGNVPMGEQGLSRVSCGPKLQLLPHLSQSIPSSWKMMPVDFLSFSAILTSHLSRSFVGDPTKHIGSGRMHLVGFKPALSRFSLLKVLMDSDSGEHLGSEHVTVLMVRAFRLEVVTEPGMITVDGEAMPYGTLQVELHPGLARLMCRKRRMDSDVPG